MAARLHMILVPLMMAFTSTSAMGYDAVSVDVSEGQILERPIPRWVNGGYDWESCPSGLDLNDGNPRCACPKLTPVPKADGKVWMYMPDNNYCRPAHHLTKGQNCPTGFRQEGGLDATICTINKKAHPAPYKAQFNLSPYVVGEDVTKCKDHTAPEERDGQRLCCEHGHFLDAKNSCAHYYQRSRYGCSDEERAISGQGQCPCEKDYALFGEDHCAYDPARSKLEASALEARRKAYRKQMEINKLPVCSVYLADPKGGEQVFKLFIGGKSESAWDFPNIEKAQVLGQKFVKEGKCKEVSTHPAERLLSRRQQEGARAPKESVNSEQKTGKAQNPSARPK